MRVKTGFRKLTIHFLLVIGLIAVSCEPSTDTEFPIPPAPADEYTLEVSVSPSGGGIIEPSSTSYEEDESVTVQAIPSEGWFFDQWTGDLESEENPFTFTITQNTNLTANFVETQSIYEVRLVLATSDSNIEVEFGQVEGATGGYDEGVDVEAPSDPPAGALHAWFDIDDFQLIQDFRSSTRSQVTWELNYQTGNSEELDLSWGTVLTQIEGSLILENEEQTFQVDLLEETSYEIDQSSSGTLVITYMME